MAYLVNIIHHAIHDLSLERFEDYGAVAGDELGLAAAAEHHALPYVENRYDRDDVAELARTGALDIRIQLRLQELEHPGAEVRGVEKDCVGEFFLETSVSAGRSCMLWGDVQ